MTMVGITKLAKWPYPAALTGVARAAFANPSILALAAQNLIGSKEHKTAKSSLSLSKLRYFKSCRIRTYKQFALDFDITPLESSRVFFHRPKWGLVSRLESALTCFPHLKFFRICTYIKPGGVGGRTVNQIPVTTADASADTENPARLASLPPYVLASLLPSSTPMEIPRARG